MGTIDGDPPSGGYPFGEEKVTITPEVAEVLLEIGKLREQGVADFEGQMWGTWVVCTGRLADKMGLAPAEVARLAVSFPRSSR